MKREDIHNFIASMSLSQGFYGRLMAGHYGDYDSILDWLANEIKPQDGVDVVMALEC